MNVNHPFVARATPSSTALPGGFERTRVAISAALPMALPVTIRGFDGAFVLALASGRVRGWLSLGAEAVIVAGAEQKEAAASTPVTSAVTAARARLTPILMVLSQGSLADVVPLTPGLRQIVAVGKARRAVCELIVLDFQLTASCVNSGNVGASWIDLAVRPLEATERFETPIVRTPYPQAALQRSSGNVAFDMRFDSEVGETAQASGAPVGGLNWWLTNEHA